MNITTAELSPPPAVPVDELKTQVAGLLGQLEDWQRQLDELESELAGQRGESAAALGDLALDRATRVRRVADASAIEKVLESDLAHHRGKLDPIRQVMHAQLRDALTQVTRLTNEATEAATKAEIERLNETLDPGITEAIGEDGLRGLARHATSVKAIKQLPKDAVLGMLFQAPLPPVGTLKACATILLNVIELKPI
jgi:septal ring factor EnvC (AmiA/AmiB activator)